MRLLDGGEVPVDEGSADVDDVSLIDEGRETLSAQSHSIDPQMDEDGHPARRGNDRSV